MHEHIAEVLHQLLFFLERFLNIFCVRVHTFLFYTPHYINKTPHELSVISFSSRIEVRCKRQEFTQKGYVESSRAPPRGINNLNGLKRRY